jgi:HlyD family secretion protein
LEHRAFHFETKTSAALANVLPNYLFYMWYLLGTHLDYSLTGNTGHQPRAANQMDRLLEKKRRRLPLLILAIGLLVTALAYAAFDRTITSRLSIDPNRVTTATVEEGAFSEYYPFDGTVEPVTTVFLDIEEGGRVDEIFVDGGEYVEKGDPILRFSNAALQRNAIDTETRLLENLNALRNTQLSLEQNALLRKEALLDLDQEISGLEKLYARYQALMSSKSQTDGVLSREVFEKTGDNLAYAREKRRLLEQRIERESVLTRQQLAHADRSIERLNLSLDLLHRTIDSLNVRAPISGFLSNVNAQVGQNINRGQRIGQIDQLEKYKLRVRVDQYYISRVQVGTTGRFTLEGHTYSVLVDKIYPEIVDNVFLVDMTFEGAAATGLRRGQSLIVEMTFSQPTKSLMLARSGFQQSGGRWVYRISDDGRSARRTAIRLGRQNPRYVEVLDGLGAGDWIVSSSYEGFNEVEQLTFNEPLRRPASTDRVPNERATDAD